MNKMKRFLMALMVAIMFGSSFVSCIDNEVSPEVKKIYEGRAELLSSQAEMNRAEAALSEAKAKLEEARAASQTIANDTAIALAVIAAAKAEMDLQIAIKKHVALLATADLVLVDSLFNRYVLYKGRADATANELNIEQRSLRTLETSLAAEKYDTIGMRRNLNVAIAEKANLIKAKAKLEEVLVAYQSGGLSAKKIEIEDLINVIAIRLTEIKVETKEKENNKKNLEAELLKLTGNDTLDLLAQYKDLRADSIRLGGEKTAKEDLIKSKNKAIVDAIAKLAAHDVTLEGLKSAKTDASNNKTAKTEDRDSIVIASATATAIYDRLSVDATSMEDSLNASADSLANFIRDNRGTGLQDNLTAAEKTKEAAQTAFEKARDIFNNDKAGSPRDAGDDGELGNDADALPNTYKFIKGEATNIEAITAPDGTITMGLVTRVTFGTSEYYTLAAIPNKEDAIGTTPAVRYEISTTSSDSLGMTDVGKYFDVEADDMVSSKTNEDIFTESTTALVAAKAALNTAQDNFDNYAVILKAKQDRYDELLDLFQNQATILSAAKTAKESAIAELATAEKKLAAAITELETATGKVTNFPTKAYLNDIINNTLTPVEIEQLEIDIAAIEVEITDTNSKMTSKRVEIAVASSSTDEEGATKLKEKILSVVDDIAELTEESDEKSDLKLQYEGVITVIDTDVNTIKLKIVTKDGDIDTQDIEIKMMGEALETGIVDNTYYQTLIAITKGKIAFLTAEINSLIELATIFKNRAAAALAAISS